MPTTSSTAQRAYLTATSRHWTRVEMVLELYRAAIRQIQRAQQAHQDHQALVANAARLKAVRIVQGIVAGLDLTRGELPLNIARLCEFAQHCLLDSQPANWGEAIRVLTPLKEAFEAIREEANVLEAQGEFPAIEPMGHIA